MAVLFFILEYLCFFPLTKKLFTYCKHKTEKNGDEFGTLKWMPEKILYFVFYKDFSIEKQKKVPNYRFPNSIYCR